MRPGAIPSRTDLLDSVPHLNPAVQWRDLDSGQVLATYRKAGALPVRLLRRLLLVPEMAELTLDEAGSKVVRRIDGKRRIHELIQFVMREFKLNRREAEMALLKYLDLMARRRLIGFEVRGRK